MDLSTKADPSSPAASPTTVDSNPPKHNPYQRIASRRAIACVTCAKAKTKCDKGLPSCSRCIAKGIKCDPRSTRRTSENSFRTSIKKPFASLKRHHTSSKMPSLNRHISQRDSASSNRSCYVPAAPHLDLNTAVKIAQYAPSCSEIPMLTPLPTYTSSVDGCYFYPDNPHQDMSRYIPSMESDGMPTSGPLTPQTPQSITYKEPLAITDTSDSWVMSQPWSDDSMSYIAPGLDGDITTLLPAELWSTPQYVHSALIAQVPWAQSSLSTSPQSVTSDFATYARVAPSLSISECSTESYDSSGTFYEDWATREPTTPQFDMTNMVTPAPIIHGFPTDSCTTMVWEDVLWSGSAPY